MSTFDGINLIITLDSTGTGSGEVNWQDVYSEWKDWLLSTTLNRKFPHAFTPDGGAPLTSIIDQGRYYFLNNKSGWRIKPPEENITYYAVGNLAVNDTSIPALKPTDGTFTAAILGLQPITQGVTPVMADQLAFGSFSGGVWVDQVNGTSGTGLIDGSPIGNAQYPSDNFTDAKTICIIRGLPQTFFVIGNATLGTGDDIAGFVVVGQNASRTHITINEDADTLGCEIREAHIHGNLDGGTILRNCVIEDLNYVNGFVYNCMIDPGIISLGGSTTAHFLNCYSGVPGISTPTIDMNGIDDSQDTPLAIRGYNGGIKLIDKTGSGSVSIDLASGQVVIDSACINGIVVVRGDGKVVDSLGNHMLSGTYNGNLTLINECNYGDHVHDIWKSLGLNPLDQGSGSVIDVINFNKYEEHTVFIDTELSPIVGFGTEFEPFGITSNAIDFAEDNGFRKLGLLSDLTVDRLIKNFYIYGVGGVPTVDTNNKILDKSTFYQVTLTGSYSGTIVARDCELIGTNTTVNGFFNNCAFGSSFEVPDGGTAGIIYSSAIVRTGLVKPIFSIGGVTGTATLQIMGFVGGITITNCNQTTDNVKVVLTGIVEIDSSCTNGIITVIGNVKPIDNSGSGCTVNWFNIDPGKVQEIYNTQLNKRHTDEVAKTITTYEDDQATIHKVFDYIENINGEIITIMPQ